MNKILLISAILFSYSMACGANDLLNKGQDYPDDLVAGVDAWSKGNYVLAHNLLQPLSADGDAVAQYIIGLMYFRGKVVQKNYKKSIKFMQLSAEQGYFFAEHKLGSIYFSGLLGKPDYKKAIKWFRHASKQGYAPSQYFLATLYENGDGIQQDYIRAHMWFSLSAKKNIIAKDERDRIAMKLSPSQITDSQRMARVCEEEGYRNCD
ncbi:MAG: hypothetical protein CMH70_09320 [Nitrosomonadaceae bacterium]|nr:hypothetical protein [Nitrosomonadaceae bacterium]|tara:strand:- start:11773 stop:12393 length:621 start_codon:yes stop_codon:yes gene_type:complete